MCTHILHVCAHTSTVRSLACLQSAATPGSAVPSHPASGRGGPRAAGHPQLSRPLSLLNRKEEAWPPPRSLSPGPCGWTERPRLCLTPVRRHGRLTAGSGPSEQDPVPGGGGTLAGRADKTPQAAWAACGWQITTSPGAATRPGPGCMDALCAGRPTVSEQTDGTPGWLCARASCVHSRLWTGLPRASGAGLGEARRPCPRPGPAQRGVPGRGQAEGP